MSAPLQSGKHAGPHRGIILTGDAIAMLKTLRAGSVQCCVTSPPYWGLRDYGIPPTTWPDGWVGALGLEPTIDLYVAHILAGSRKGDVVLDPFSGAGTTGLVAMEHERRYLGVELNPDYVEMAEKRLGLHSRSACPPNQLTAAS